MRRPIVPLLILLTALPAGRAQSAGQWAEPQALWSATCAYCHDSGVAPQLKGRGLDPEAVATIVRQGLPGMPAFHPSEVGDAELRAFSLWLSRTPAPEGEKGR